jgi:hypothetical protein
MHCGSSDNLRSLPPKPWIFICACYAFIGHYGNILINFNMWLVWVVDNNISNNKSSTWTIQKDLTFRANAIRRKLVTWHLIMSFLTSNFLYQIDLGHCAYFMCVELNIWFWRDLRTTGESNEVPNTLVLASFTTIDQWQYVAIVFRWLTCAPAFNLAIGNFLDRCSENWPATLRCTCATALWPGFECRIFLALQ